MNKLSDVELRVLDLKLFDYQQIDRKIAIRKLEIQTETSNDCNVGGGKANTISNRDSNYYLSNYHRYDSYVFENKRRTNK
jgi:hypothetical protein